MAAETPTCAAPMVTARRSRVGIMTAPRSAMSKAFCTSTAQPAATTDPPATCARTKAGR